MATVVYLFFIPQDAFHPQKSASSLLLATSYTPPEEYDDLCEDYGCSVYPDEWDESSKDQIQQQLEQADNEFDWNMATMTRRSTRHKPPFNQDAAIIVRPFRTKQTLHDEDFFLGVFDGHGMQGHHVSNYAANMVPEILQRKFNEHEGAIMTDAEIVETLNATFLETDVRAPPSAMFGGTTATVTLRRHGKLFVANTGDSRTIVVTVKGDETVEIPFMTKFHKAHLPEEQARIQSMGGNVKYPPDKPGQSRVWVYSSASRETIGLAMSRSIGDWEWGDVGVIAEPTVDVLDVAQFDNAFVLAASDGMWDARKPQFFATKFAESLHKQRTQHPLLTCHDVIERISPKNPTFYRDDITMIVMKLLPDP